MKELKELKEALKRCKDPWMAGMIENEIHDFELKLGIEQDYAIEGRFEG